MDEIADASDRCEMINYLYIVPSLFVVEVDCLYFKVIPKCTLLIEVLAKLKKFVVLPLTNFRIDVFAVIYKKIDRNPITNQSCFTTTKIKKDYPFKRFV